MERKYNFISGLPRSGSTLLSAILNQNPKFTAGITDPLINYTNSIIEYTCSDFGMMESVSVDKRKAIIKAIFNGFYEDCNEICFNTNRFWTFNTTLLKGIFPNYKMIICVRDIPWILDSFERLHLKDPYTIKPLYNSQLLTSVYDRCSALMNINDDYIGHIAQCLNGVKQSIFSDEISNLCFVEYESLVQNPEEIMRKIYNFLEEPYFEHDFNNIVGLDYSKIDKEIRFEGLHDVRPKVEYVERNSIIPIDIFKNYEGFSFWKYPHIFDEYKTRLNWFV